MQESPDKLSVYERIGTDDVPHCCCGECECCNARGASIVGVDHLAQTLMSKLPLEQAIATAGTFLSPGETDTSTLAGHLRRDFGKSTTETMLQAAAEFRKCETIKEASGVAERFPLPTTV